ncbi:3-deoxy-7-phosphoheptulonate synthase [Streptomyces sp. NPDC088116]|uniref:3-deoxy-7-phosphoheptulonate synthase n=1 Tax=Streptomyces sp. NPDC088116 TaxID=3365825 RepID=UPI003822C15D
MRTEVSPPVPGTPSPWHPGRWRRPRAQQPPGWPESAGLREIRERLVARPPLVTPAEVAGLRRRLADVASGRGVVIQMGDCAETFALPTPTDSARTVALARAAASLAEERLGVRVVSIGRIAGQFSKPRTSLTEEVDGVQVPSFRGDLVNASAPDELSRRPEPRRLLWGYEHAARTLSLLRRAGADGTPEPGSGARVSSVPALAPGPVLWTSHEALILDYEEPLTRWDAESGAWVLCSTHFPWVGERTRHVDGAHVRFLAEVANAVGCKVGPGMTPREIVRLAGILDPGRRPGRLVLIARMGEGRVGAVLPGLVEAVRRAGHPVGWLCDPMHGNTVRASSGHKTRHMSAVLAEIAGFVAAVRSGGGRPGGLHLESTADSVTECVGGRCGILESQVPEAYYTACDPRLNADQALEAVAYFADALVNSSGV